MRTSEEAARAFVRDPGSCACAWRACRRNAYEVTTKCFINRFDIPACQPDARVSVLIEPADPMKVAVA
jgi:hypothetical protein